MRYVFPFFLAVFLSFPGQAANKARIPQSSLFFTSREAHDAEMMALRLVPSGKGDIRLGAVLYYGADDWVLWLQGEKWTPKTAHEDIQVLAVTEDHVRLLWRKNKDRKPVEVTLRPHQSYRLATGEMTTER